MSGKKLTKPIIKGIKVSYPWFRDKYPELHENIMQCEHHKDIGKLFRNLKSVMKDPILENLWKTREELIDFAKELNKELEEKYI